jgi:hypothetical protein
MKDNAQETLVNYNGNARPGEIVADLTVDPPTLYIGNNQGQLTLLNSGGGSYGNTQVGQYLAAGLVGNIIPSGNSTHSLGNLTNYWGLALLGQVQIGGNLSYEDTANLIVVENKDSFADIIAQNKNSGGNASMNIVVLNDNPGNVYMAMGVNSSTFTPLYNTLFEIPNAGYVSHTTNQIIGPQSSESGNSRMFLTYDSGAEAIEINEFGAIGWGASYNGNLTQGNFGNVGQALTSTGPSSVPTWTSVAITESGSWTVTPGTASYSFEVPTNGVYQLWVRGNIPNGIITYTATVSVTNSNVPVLGQQFAWNYEGGGNLILFTSIPSQIIGTAGAISNAQPVVGTTTNTFVFGIQNNTAGNVAVNWGYTNIS